MIHIPGTQRPTEGQRYQVGRNDAHTTLALTSVKTSAQLPARKVPDPGQYEDIPSSYNFTQSTSLLAYLFINFNLSVAHNHAHPFHSRLLLR